MNEESTIDMQSLPEATDYEKFDTEWYFKNYYETDDACANLHFDLSFIHKVYVQCNLKGPRLLDIGTGPTVHSILSACRHVDEIYLSDFSTSNLEFLRQWHRGEKQTALKTLQFIDSIDAQKVRISPAEREKLARERVKDIIRIDITNDIPLGDWKTVREFDVISSSYCLEAAINTPEEFEKCINRMTGLLKKGGHLILIGGLEGSFYRVGDVKYSSLNITKQQVTESLEKAGMAISVMDVAEPSEEDLKYYHISSYYLIAARKL